MTGPWLPSQLPEIKIRMGLANFPIQSGGFTTEGMTQAQLGLRMEVPPSGMLDASARQYALPRNPRCARTAEGRDREVLASVRSRMAG